MTGHLLKIVAFYLIYRGLVVTGMTRPQDLLFRKLQESEDRHRTVLQTALEGFWRVDLQGRLLEVNAAYCRMSGYTQAELLTMNIADLEANESPAEVSAHLQQLISRGQDRFETRHRCKDGSVIDLEVSILYQPAAGESAVAFLHDITARKQMEQALQASEQHTRAKLASILSPEGDIGALDLADIIDSAAIQSLMDDFYKLTRLPMSLIDLKGKVLVGIGWQDICTKFHRVHPETRQRCLESDTILTQAVPSGDFKLYKCRNNLWDIVTPVMIGGQHVGNLFMGQFFFAGEAPDYDFFRAQARQFVFDEAAYLNALAAVPHLQRETVETAMGFFTKLANMLSLLSLGNIKLARAVAQQERLVESLRLSEEKSRDNEQFLTDIFDHIQDGLCVLDADLNIVRVNPAMASFPHTTPIVGRKCYEVYQSSLAPCPVCPAQGAFQTGRAEQKIVSIPGADGSESFAEVHAFPLLDRATAQVKQVIEYIRDVTPRLRMEQELRERELFLRETQKIARLGGWMANPHTGYLKWTDAVFDILEIPRDRQPLLPEGIKFFLPEDIPILTGNMVHCLATGEPYCLECQVITATGKRLWTEVRGLAPIVEGERSYVIGTFQDITGRKQADATRQELETRLFQAQKMEAIGTLAGGIAHDFNNILAAILGYTEMAAMNLINTAQANNYLQQVLTATHRAKDLVAQILAFSRRLDSEKKPLVLNFFVTEVLKLLRASLPATIEIRPLMQNRQPILADATQIHQIIMNLATNAFHAMEATGGILEITVADVTISHPLPTFQGQLAPGHYVKLQFRDNGPGIDPAILSRVFEPYFTTKEVGKGTGMGLAMVLGIVKSHGGDITLESTLGQGTTFSLYFPAVAETQAPRATLSLPDVPPGTGHILFVDDEPALAELGKAALSSLGYQVTTMTSSRAALDLLRQESAAFDLLITDLTMPHLTGLDLARELQTIRPGLPIILCTGQIERVSPDKTQSLGIQEILMKPLQIRRLGQTVHQVLTAHNH